MVKIFHHWIRRATVIHMVRGLVYSFSCVLFVQFFPVQLKLVSFADIAYMIIFLVVLSSINSRLWLPQKGYQNSMSLRRSRGVVTLYLATPLPLIAIGIFALSGLPVLHHDIVIYSGYVALLGTLVNLGIFVFCRSEAMMAPRVLIFGAGVEAKFVSQVLGESDPDVQIVGFIPGHNETELCVPEASVLPRGDSLAESASALNVREIVIAVHERRGGILPLRELLDCKLRGISVLDLSSYFERILGQIRLSSLNASWLIFGEGFKQGSGRKLVKRLLDFISALTLFLVTFPVMGVTAILIILEDGFPIFYKQERVGMNGRLFNIVKFRSMRTDAEGDGTPRWATEKDTRTTRVGNLIRKLRIDELPQLYNVLLGEMSLVGPRPERPYFVNTLISTIPYYDVRHSIQPGVTGWAQVNYHYGASVADSIQKLQYDLYYVKNHSLFLDLVIMLETVVVVLTRRGAQ